MECKNNNPWHHTKLALQQFRKNLQCNKCHAEANKPMRYGLCGHLFCSSCIHPTSKCLECQYPTKRNAMYPDDHVSNMLTLTKMISKIAEETQPSSTKTSSNHRAQNLGQPLDNTLNKSLNITRDINKPNGKGETRLHVACMKGNLKLVQTLLDLGANPNTKDHAGWTPLQETVSFGYYEICKLLLEGGAQPDTPGLDNRTALHEAVKNGRTREIELLLNYHADVTACDSFGKTAYDYADSDEVRELLINHKPADTVLDQTFESTSNVLSTTIGTIISNTTTILGLYLHAESDELLCEVARKHKIKLVKSFSSAVTHVVVEVNDQHITPVCYDILLSILHGKWILSSQWIRLCMTFVDLSDIELTLFEVRGTTGARTSDTPSRARQNTQKQNPRLFDGCYFYFAMNNNSTYTLGDLKFTKQTLSRLVTEGGGQVLSREPNPENIQSTPRAIPFHVARNPTHPLYTCSHYIIYAPGKDEHTIKYNMKHIRSLPLIWLIESIEQFTLLDPSYIGIPL